MDVDVRPVPIARDLNANFVDDDDLQAALARSRRAKVMKPKKISPEELAKRSKSPQSPLRVLKTDIAVHRIVAEQRLEEEQEQAQAVKVEEDATGLIFDETSEFVQSVGINPIVKPKQEPKEPTLVAAAPAAAETRDASMAPGDVKIEELEAGEVAVKEEEDDDDDYNMAMLDEIERHMKLEDAEIKQEDGAGGVGGTSSEQTFSSGMAATLNILRQQGALTETSQEQREREKLQQQRDLWISEQRFKLAKKELERFQARGGGGNKDQAQREYDNRLRDLQERREIVDTFNTGYKPDVNIVYYDDYGRELNVKEAWKALSHKFHGKLPGKMKTEKKLKKIEEEKKKLAMASGDTPLSMSKAFQERQQKTGQAHFVLSVGNRGLVSFTLFSVHSDRLLIDFFFSFC